MNIKQRSKRIIDYFNSLTDEEFNQLLIESGLDDCPFEERVTFNFLSEELGEYNTESVYNNESQFEILYSPDVEMAA